MRNKTNLKDKDSRLLFEEKIIRRAWEDEVFRAELLHSPRQAIEAAFGVTLPGNFHIRILEETEDKLYFVIPARPANLSSFDELSDDDLDAVAGGADTTDYVTGGSAS